MSSRLASIVLSLGILSLFASPLSAQKPAESASVAVHVTDATGGVIPNATVQIQPLAELLDKNLRTDGSGNLSFQVPLGSYDLTVKATGFRAGTKHIEVQDGIHQTINVTLEVGVGGGVAVQPAYPPPIATVLAGIPDQLSAACDEREDATVALSSTSCTRAPESQIETLAHQMAVALSHSKQKTVVVLDFFGADKPGAVGQKLADEFAAALAKSTHDFQVRDRSQVLELLQKNSLEPGSIRDAETASWFLQNTGADAVILGTMSAGLGGLGVSVEAYRVADLYPIASFQTSVPFTAELQALAGDNEDGEFASLPHGGRGGYTEPTCSYCPSPSLPMEAQKRTLKGTAVLEFTVDEEGRTSDIRVKIAAPDGFTPQAVKAVQAWKLKPATGPDGKPTAVRQEATLTFNLM